VSALPRPQVSTPDSSALRAGAARPRLTAFRVYALLLGVFTVASALQLHGSSLSAMDIVYGLGHRPLIGRPKAIRSDEWSIHTPAILHQLYRAEPLSPYRSSYGPGMASLLGSIPIAHPTTLLRPQFWSFFLLPPEYAFAVYWQFKTLLLLGGVFALMHLLTGAVGVSAAMALAFWLSPYIQWGFSWPTLLPEMLGLACLTTALLCRLVVARKSWVIYGAAVLAGACAVNFTLSAYPPQQVPIAWVCVAVVLGWTIGNWRVITDTAFLAHRAAGIAVFALVVTGGLLLFWIDARDAIAVAAATFYPGQRRVGGGSLPALFLLSHFLDFWKAEQSIPPVLNNICEASGFLWLAPLTLLMGGPGARDGRRAVYFALLGVFVVLASWIVLPIPEPVGRVFALNLVPSHRAIPGLGLANMLLLTVFLARHCPLPVTRGRMWAIGAGSFFVLFVILLHVNQALGHMVRMDQVVVAALYAATLIVCLDAGWVRAFTVSLLVPLLLADGLVNPIDRGLSPVTQSDLATFLAEHPEVRRGRFAVYSDGFVAPNYFLAHGLDVLNSFRIVPDVEELATFDTGGRARELYNVSGYFRMKPLPPGEASRFEPGDRPGLPKILVSPLDPKLKALGVTVIAFDAHPPMEWVHGLRRLSADPIGAFWLYAID